MRIRQKIVFATISSGAIVMIIGFSLLYHLAFTNLRAEIFSHLETTAQSRADHVYTYIQQEKGRVSDFASDGKIIECLSAITEQASDCPPEELSQHLSQNVRPTMENLVEISVLNAEGQVVASSLPQNIGQQRSQADYYLAGKNIATFGDVSISPQKEYVLTIAAPVISRTKFIGMIVGNIRLNSLNNILSDRSGLGQTGETLIAKRTPDGDAEYISLRRFASDTNALQTISKDSLNSPITQALLKNEIVTEDSVDYRGQAVLAATQYIDVVDWGLVAKIDKAEAFSSLKELQTAVTMLFIASIFMLAFVAFWIAGTISRPIAELQHGASEYEKGNFDLQIGTQAKDEIGQLSRAFDRMAAAIKASRAAVDQKVAEQTAQIQARNEDLQRQRQAILNVLEDVQAEKEKSKALANDLQKFQLAIKNSSDHVVITNPDGVILYANPAVEAITGYTPEEVVGKKVGTKRLWGGQMTKEFYQKLWHTIKVEKKHFVGIITNRHKNGHNFVSETHIDPILNSDNEVAFFVATARDITRAKEIDRMKTDFLSVAAHQLRTPLGSMRWNMELLLEGDTGQLSNPAKKVISQLYESNQHMIDLVNDLLDVSRIDQGRVADEPKPTDIIAIVEEAATEITPEANNRSISIHIQNQITKRPTINLDPNRFREVIQNLLSNAIKYNKQNGTVTVSFQQSTITNPNNQAIPVICISIADTGLGVPYKDQHKLFSKFYRAENAVKSETEGSGLGLFVVKSYVEAWGGSVSFESKENQGSTFTINIPLQPNQGTLNINLAQKPTES